MLNCTLMTHFDRILSEAKELLSEAEQRRLSFALLPEEDETDPKIDDAWREEVHRRRLGRRNGETQAQPWEDVEAELMSL